jgi:hypoxanthine phosphoribosyltransferase
LLDKPSARVVSVRADFVGFEVGPRFVVGYGLDIDGRYRNLPYVAEVTLD